MKEGDRIAIRVGDLTDEDIAAICAPRRKNWVLDEHGIVVRAGAEEPMTDADLDAIKAVGRSLAEG